MKQFLRWILTLLGYIVYTIGVIILLLWFLFPVDTAQVWLQRQLDAIDPSLVWNINSIEKDFPLKIRLSDILVNGKNGQENPLFHITEMQLSPDMGELMKFKKQVPILYQLDTLNGTVKGDFFLSGNDPMVRCSGEMQNLQIGGLEEIWKKTNRTGSGEISGTFQYSGLRQNPLQGDLLAALKVSDGKLSLLQKIFGLDRIDFSSMTANLTLRDKIASFENGAVDSRLFNASFEGTLKLTGSLYTSNLNIQGFMEPRPELFGGLKDATAVSFIRNQLQNDKLSFTINGTLVEPGILFKGASGIIDGIIEGGIR